MELGSLIMAGERTPVALGSRLIDPKAWEDPVLVAEEVKLKTLYDREPTDPTFQQCLQDFMPIVRASKVPDHLSNVFSGQLRDRILHPPLPSRVA